MGFLPRVGIETSLKKVRLQPIGWQDISAWFGARACSESAGLCRNRIICWGGHNIFQEGAYLSCCLTGKSVVPPANLTTKLLGSFPQETHLRQSRGVCQEDHECPWNSGCRRQLCYPQNWPSNWGARELASEKPAVFMILKRPLAELIKGDLHWMPYMSAAKQEEAKHTRSKIVLTIKPLLTKISVVPAHEEECPRINNRAVKGKFGAKRQYI